MITWIVHCYERVGLRNKAMFAILESTGNTLDLLFRTSEPLALLALGAVLIAVSFGLGSRSGRLVTASSRPQVGLPESSRSALPPTAGTVELLSR